MKEREGLEPKTPWLEIKWLSDDATQFKMIGNIQ